MIKNCDNCIMSSVKCGNLICEACFKEGCNRWHPMVSEQEVEDFNTERMDMPERIEAGLATPREIEDHMRKDFEMFGEFFVDGL
jgi:hypothetical protein